MTRRRTQNRRPRRKKRKDGGGGSMPTRSLSRGDVEKAAEAHGKRKPHAQRIDESMKASIAQSLDQWLSEPNRYDIPGVDYPGKSLQEALEKADHKEPGKTNPYLDSDTTKKHLQPIVEEYHQKMGLETPLEDLRLSAVNRGHPAKAIHHDDPEESPIIRFNYEHFQQLYEDLDDPEFVDRYMRYAVAHELSHVQQHEEFSWDEVREIKNMSLRDFETDADARASVIVGTPVEEIEKDIRGMEKKLLKKDLESMRPEEKPPVTKAEKPLEPHPDSHKYSEVPVEALKELPGVGPKTIQNLEAYGYKDVGEIYSDSAQFHGLLAQCPGIGDYTAQMLHKQIEQHIKPATKTPDKPNPKTPGKKDKEITTKTAYIHGPDGLLTEWKISYWDEESKQDSMNLVREQVAKEYDIHFSELIATTEKALGKKEDKRVNDIINQIQAEKASLTHEAIQELIKKQNALHANLLTDEAAAILVADQLGVKVGPGEPGEQPFSIPSEYREWVSKAENQADLDTVMVQANRDQKLSESQRIEVAGLVEARRDNIVREKVIPSPTEEDVLVLLDQMYPRGNIGKSREELKDSVVKWMADKKGIDPDNPQSQYEEHMLNNIDPLSDQLIERMIDGHWFDEHNGLLYLEGEQRLLRDIDPEKAKGKMREMMEQNPDITDEEILDKLVEAYDVEPVAADSFKSLARGRLEDLPRPTEDVSLYDELRDRKFFAYSGADGDLYRKQGLGGWRVQVYWGTDLEIQKKQNGRWVTIADLDTESPEDKQLAVDFVDEWMKEPEILEPYLDEYGMANLRKMEELRTQAKVDALPQDQLNSLRNQYREGYETAIGVALDHQLANRRYKLHDELIDRGYTKEETDKILSGLTETHLKEKYATELNELQGELLENLDEYNTKASNTPLMDWKRAVENSRWNDAAYRHADEVISKEINDIIHSPKKLPKSATKGRAEPLTRPKNSEARKEYYKQANPYTYLASMSKFDNIEVNGGNIKITGMDPSHVAMSIAELPNRLGIPDGNYAGKFINPDELTASMVTHPDKVEWVPFSNGGEIQITKKIKGKDKTARITLEKDGEPEDIPNPKIRFQAKTPVKLGELKELLENSPDENFYIKTFMEDGKHVLRAWWNEKRGGGAAHPISHAVTLSEDAMVEEPTQAVYDQNIIAQLLESLEQQGITEGYMSLSTDMPFKLETENQECRNTYYQAPKIGAEDPELDYYPDDPRAKITREDYPSKKAWRRQAIPYTAWIHVSTFNDSRGEPYMKATKDKVHLRSMDAQNIQVIEVETPNTLGVEPGEYGSDHLMDDANKTTLKYPDHVIWDPEINEFKAQKKDDEGYMYLKPGQEDPIPKIQLGPPLVELGKQDFKDFREAVNKAWKAQLGEESPKMGVKADQIGLHLRYQHKDEYDEWETIHLQPSKAPHNELTEIHIDPDRLRDALNLLENMDPDQVEIRQRHDEVFQLIAHDGDTIIRYHLAPIIGA